MVFVVAFLVTVSSAWAVCAPDTEGLPEAAAFSDEERFTDGHLDATGARTQGDFAYAAINDLMYSDNGRWFSDVLSTMALWNSTISGPQRPWLVSGTACNDIGQCQTVRIVVQTEVVEGSALADAAAQIITSGVVRQVWTDVQGGPFTVTVTSEGGQVTNPMVFNIATVLAVQATGDGFSLSTDGQTLDTACKDNDGDLVDEPSPPTNEPIGGGGGGDSDSSGGGASGGGVTSGAGGGLWDCWESGGVICKRV